MVTKITSSNFSASVNNIITAAASIPTISNVQPTDGSYIVSGLSVLDPNVTSFVKITGTNFSAGSQVFIESTIATTVTYINSTQLNVILPSRSSGSYVIYVVNPDGSVAIRINAVTYSTSPVWSTSSTLSENNLGSPISIQLAASSDSNIVYAVSSGLLPPGLSLSSGGLLSGTVSGLSESTTYNFTVTATDVENQTNNRAFSINITVNDPYWSLTTLMINNENSSTSFINDASTNNFELVVSGDTKPSNFSPYYGNGYYSNFFDGTGDYLTVPDSTSLQMGSGDFTIEFWIYYNSITGYQTLYSKGYTAAGDLLFQTGNGNGALIIYLSGSAVITESTGAVIGQWYHYALVRSGTTVTLYRNGVSRGTATSSVNLNATNQLGIGATGKAPAGGAVGDYPFNGYISNLRVVKGTAVYTSSFTPSTTPLLTIANTQLLICQANRLIDNSNNHLPITKNGDVTVSSNQPFQTKYVPQLNNTVYSSYFNGSSYLTIAQSSVLQLGATYTIEAWIYPTSTAKQQIFVVGGCFYYIESVSGFNLSSWSTSGNGNNYGGTLTVNAWNHVAWQRDTDAVLRGFINGVPAFNNTGSGVNTLGPATIGSSAGVDNYSGYISNFRIVKGTALYATTGFNVPNPPLTAITNTVLLTGNSATVVDNSTSAFTLTQTGTVTSTTFSPVIEVQSYTSTPVSYSLSSAYFDGTSDYIIIPYNSALDLLTGDFTVECWVYLTAISGFRAIVGQWQQTGGNGGWILGINGTNFNFNFGPSSESTAIITSSATAVVNQWYHVAIVRSGNIFTLYQNGVSVGTATSTATKAALTAINLVMGNYYNTSNGFPATGATDLAGYVSNLRIVKSAVYPTSFTLPSSPLTSITNTSLLTCQYSGGSNNSGFVDQSNFNNIISRTGNTTQGSFSPYSLTGWSNYFNGSSYLNLGTNSAFAIGTADFTIEAWVYPTTAEQYYACIFGGTAFGSSSDWNLMCGTSLFPVFQFTNNTSDRLTSTTAMTQNAWNHLAVSRQSGTARIFVNGVLGGSGSFASQSLANSLSKSIGAAYDGNGSTTFTGYISNLRIVSGSAVYTTAFTPPTSPLVAITGTILLTCQSNGFVDNSSLGISPTIGGSPSIQALNPFGNKKSIPITYSNYFDGTGDYFDYNTSIAITTGPFTIEFWIYPTTSGTSSAILDNALWSIGDNGGWYVFLGSDNKVQISASVGTWNQFPGIITSTATITTNRWTHVAIVRDSSNQVNIYFDGVVAATPVTYATTLNTGNGAWTGLNFKLGRHVADGGTYNVYTGYLSNVRIVNGTAVYNSAFTPPTSPLTSIANTLVLTCQSSTIIDNTTNNNYVITASGDVKPKTFNPFGITTTTNSYSPAEFGGSMYFDGTGDNISVVSNPSLNVGSGNFTLEWWMYPTSLSGANQSLFFTGTGNLVVLMVSGTGIIQPGNYQNTGIVNPATGVPQNAWTHVAITRSGNVWNVYYNGVLAGTNSNYAFTPSTSSFTIGTGASPYFGYLSDYKLTVGSVLYTANFYPSFVPASPTTTIKSTTYSASLLLNGTTGGIVDAHGTSDIETIGTVKLSTAIKKYGTASTQFGTKTDSLVMRYTPQIGALTGDFTIECWVYPTDTTISNTWGIIDARSAGATASPWLLGLGSYSAGWLMTFFNGTTYNGSTRIQANTWTHCAWVRVVSSLTFYVNGVANGTFIISGPITGGGTTVVIGSKDNGLAGYGTVGYIDELRITNGYARYTSNFTAPSASMTR